MNVLRYFVVVLAIFAANSIQTSAADTVTLDGTWWNSLSQAEKIVAVQGMLAGYSAGYTQRTLDVIDDTPPSDLKAVKEVLSFRPMRDDTGTGITFGSIVARIDAVYDNHPEAVAYSMYDFVHCAANSRLNCEDDLKRLKPYAK